VKIWHALGTLVVTCSEPPDVVLTFDTLDHPASGSQTAGRTISGKVRLTYRPSNSTMQLDTYTAVVEGLKAVAVDLRDAKRLKPRKRTAQTDSFRTRRCVSVYVIDHKLVDNSHDGLDATCKTLGLDLAGWAPDEVEAVRRFWALRHEWARFQ